MPALRVLGQKWHIAADDLPLPSLLGAAWHFAILVVTAVDLAYVLHQFDALCPYREQHVGFLSAHCACFAINGVLHTLTYTESRRGSLFENHHRRRVAPLILAIIIFYSCTVANDVYGSRLIAQLPNQQPPCIPAPGPMVLHHPTLLRFIIAATWVSLFIGFIAMVITFNLFPSYRAVSSPWLRRLRLCGVLCYCCLVPDRKTTQGGVDSDTAEQQRSEEKGLSPVVVVANLFTHVFGSVDMTISDYMAAFMLVGVRHRSAKPALTYGNAPAPPWLAESGDANLGAPCTNSTGREVLLVPPVQLEIAAGDRSSNGRSTGQQPTPPPELGADQNQPTAPGKVLQPDVVQSSVPKDSSHPGTSEAPPICQLGVHAVGTEIGINCDIARGPPGVAAGAEAGNLGSKQPVEASYETRITVDASSSGSRSVPAWDGRFAEANASEEVLEEAEHYMCFATAVYGWKMYLWMHRHEVSQCCQLCKGPSCCCYAACAQLAGLEVPDDELRQSCCPADVLLERKTIGHLTNIADADILYVCTENVIGGLLPYYIALDRVRRSVVVAVRGSLSLRDVVTDLLCEPAQLRVPGEEGTDAARQSALWAHRGMVEATGAIWRHIQQQGVLQAALGGTCSQESQQQASQQQQRGAAASGQGGAVPHRAQSIAARLKGQCDGWKLVLTGHSLGAGVAALLSLMLRPAYPDLRCWAFGPPGGLLSPQAAELTLSFCISVVHAKDMIPRLSVAAMEHLVQQLVAGGVECQVSKSVIMSRLLLRRQRPDLGELFREVPHQDMIREMQKVMRTSTHSNRDTQDTPDAKPSTRFQAARDFLPPGHLLYLERRKVEGDGPGSCRRSGRKGKGSKGQDRYASRWISAQDLMATGLVVSRSMFSDHVPDVALKGLQMAVQHAREARQQQQNGRQEQSTLSVSPQAGEPPLQQSKDTASPELLTGLQCTGVQAVRSDAVAIAVFTPSLYPTNNDDGASAMVARDGGGGSARPAGNVV